MRYSSIPWIGSALVLCLLLSPGGAASQTDPPQGDAAVEPVEVVEMVEEVGAIETVDGPASSLSLAQQIIGRNHPALVHVPIGFILAVCLLEFIALLFPRIELGRASFVLCLATVASFVPASLTGWLRSGELYAHRQAPDLFFEHRNFIMAACAVFTVSVVLRLVRKDKLEGRAKMVYLALLLLSLVLIGLGGHHGGQLVYGEDFLPY